MRRSLSALLLMAGASHVCGFTGLPKVAKTISQPTVKPRCVAKALLQGVQMTAGNAGDEDRSAFAEERERDCAAAVFVNEREMLSEQGFPRRYKAKIFSRAQTFLTTCVSGRPPSVLLADGFEFHGSREGKALTTQDFFAGEAFGRAEFYGFKVDPYEPMRVWFNARAPVHEGPSSSSRPAQSCSLTFDADGKVEQFTVHAIDLGRAPQPLGNAQCARSGKRSEPCDAGLLPKPERSYASTPPPPSPPRHTSAKRFEEPGTVQIPVVRVLHDPMSKHASQEEEALERKKLNDNIRCACL